MLAFGTAIVWLLATVGEVVLRLDQLDLSAGSDARCAGSDATQLTQKGLYSVDSSSGYVMRPSLCVRLRTREYDQVLRTNSRGMVGPDLPATKAPGEFRIVVLGDSYTVGGQVPYEQTFPAVLEQQLRQRGYSQVRVINAGVGGYTTYNEAGLLREDLSWLQPDLVVVAVFVGNDVAENVLATAAGYTLDPDHPKGFTFGAKASELVQSSIGWFPRNGNPQALPPAWDPTQPLPEAAPSPAPAIAHPSAGPIPTWVMDKSPIVTFKNLGHWIWDGARTSSRLLGKLFGVPPDPSISTEPGTRPPSKDQRKLNVSSFEWVILRDIPHTYWLDVAWPLLGAYLADIHSVAGSVGAPALVLVIPQIAQVEPNERAKTMADYRFADSEVDWDLPQRQVSLQSSRAGLPVVDLLPAFRQLSEKNELYFPGDQHFTAAGHQATAESLTRAIVSEGWLR